MPSRKGSPNKVGAQVKENVIAVFNKLEGTAGMAKWAKKNLTEFYRLYGRLIPTESTTDVTIRDVTDLSRTELLVIATGGRPGDSEAGPGEREPDGIH